MLKIIILVSILSAVCAKQYAYINNDLVEIDDPLPLPYPYQESKALREDQQNSVQNAVSIGTVIPTVVETDAMVASTSNLLCSLLWNAIGLLKRMIMYIVTSVPTLIFSLFGICNLVSLCKYFNVESFLGEKELSSYITTDRLKRAAEFVESAINKYRSLQKDMF